MKRLMILATLAALAGCSDRPVGSGIEDGTFGLAARSNAAAQMGEVSATEILSRRFAAEVPTTITFPFDSARLTPQAQQVLTRQADWIRQFPEVRFRVYGHTDLVGSGAYNKGLGLRRAQAVVAFLASQGISPRRLEALVSFGETRPVVPVLSPEQRNRRTVTAVSGFVRGRSAPLNGKYAAVVFREHIELAKRPHPPNVTITTQTVPAQ